MLQPLAATADRLYAAERTKADNTALRDADNKMGALRRSLLEDAQRGYFAMRGRSAMEGAEKVTAEWQKGISQIEAGLATEEQRSRFAAYKAQQHDQMSVAVQRHLRQEIDAEEKDVAEATISSAFDDALANYADGVAVGDAIGKAQAVIRDFGRGRGVRPEVIDRQVAEHTSKMLAGVVGRYLDAGQDLDAKAFYEAHQDEIVGGHRGKLEQALEVGSTRGESQRRADAIMSTPDITRGAAYEAAKAIEDPKVRQETEDRLTIGFARRDADERDRYEKTVETAWDYIDRGATVPTSVMSQLKAPQRAQIRSYLKAVAKGEEPATDWSRYYDLKTMASSEGTRDAFLQANLFAERGKLADAEFKELIGLQGALRKGDEAATAKLGGYQTANQIVESALRGAKLDKNKETADRFRRVVDQAVADEERRTQKPIANDRLRQITEEMLVRGVVHAGGFADFVNGFFGTNKKRKFEVTEGETLTFGIGDVPAAEAAKIKAALQRAGRPVTDDAVLELYTRRHGSAGGAP